MNRESDPTADEMCVNLPETSQSRQKNEENENGMEYDMSPSSKSSGEESMLATEMLKASGEKRKSKRPAWTAEEDEILKAYIELHGPCKFDRLRKHGLLKRDGKSCRQRWSSWLQPGRPNQRKYRGRIELTAQEEKLLTELQEKMGNCWVRIAEFFPRHTPHELKNLWHGRVKKKKIGIQIQSDEDCNSPSPSMPLAAIHRTAHSPTLSQPNGTSLRVVFSQHQPQTSQHPTAAGFRTRDSRLYLSSSDSEAPSPHHLPPNVQRSTSLPTSFSWNASNLLPRKRSDISLHSAKLEGAMVAKKRAPSSSGLKPSDSVADAHDAVDDSRHPIGWNPLDLTCGSTLSENAAPDQMLERLCCRSTSIWPSDDLSFDLGLKSLESYLVNESQWSVENWISREETFGLDEVLIEFCQNRMVGSGNPTAHRG